MNTNGDRTINLRELMSGIRARVEGDGAPPQQQTALPPNEAPLTAVLQFLVQPYASRSGAKLRESLAKARRKNNVGRWIPRPIRGLFRDQGRINEAILDMLELSTKGQNSLARHTDEMRAYLAAQYFWLRDLSEARSQEKALSEQGLKTWQEYRVR